MNSPRENYEKSRLLMSDWISRFLGVNENQALSIFNNFYKQHGHLGGSRYVEAFNRHFEGLLKTKKFKEDFNKFLEL